MSEPAGRSRRHFIQASLGLAGLACLALPQAASAQTRAALDAAKAGLERVGGRILRRDVVGVADFRPASSHARLHLVDLANGQVESVLVAHGRGSDPNHTGWLQRFSNAMDADCTSEGAYLTGDYYVGEHGHAMNLVGLDPTNSNAEARRVVVHSAWYVSPQMVAQHGMLGRSEGCFAVSEADLPKIGRASCRERA